MLIRKYSNRLVGLRLRTSFSVFLAKRVAILCRGTSRLSIRQLQSSTRRQSLQLLPQTGEVDDRTIRGLPIPADGFYRAQQHQLRAFGLPTDGSMTRQFQHGRHILGMLLRTTECHLLRYPMAPSWTVGDIPPLTQCTGRVPFHFGIESKEAGNSVKKSGMWLLLDIELKHVLVPR